ncbi:MAG: TniQ family protein [Betaproteobacteria bacterium]|jgi:hypothetical protein|nr:TniQ family protein [Betaproteobacteria bacterium]
MLSGTLWPAHPKLLPDELLSSWIVRIAETNGIRLYTLTLGLFGDRLTPWHRDIDRLAPKWLLKAICAKTGTSYWDAYHATLTGYRTHLYPRRQTSGQLRWILPVSVFGLDRHGYGQQYCPLCLAEDDTPYFRRAWRVGFYTFCPVHVCMLSDACTECGAPVVLHRRDIGREICDSKDIGHCQRCGADYRATPITAAIDIQPMHAELLAWMSSGLLSGSRYDLGFLAVMHHLCKVLGSSANRGSLLSWVTQQIGLTIAHPTSLRLPVEGCRVLDRHALVSQSLWLLEDTKRIVAAWSAKAVRFNHLLKDFDEPPKWYVETCLKLKRPMASRRSAHVHSFV